MNKQKIVALLPMKANSERVKGKNFREFYGKPLFRWILDTLLSVNDIDCVVINTDANQIIIAEVGQHQSGLLPPISYVAGGLENNSIRTTVCEILEGGEKAFRERARRLRVRLQR